jgi:hypothetical protein
MPLYLTPYRICLFFALLKMVAPNDLLDISPIKERPDTLAKIGRVVCHPIATFRVQDRGETCAFAEMGGTFEGFQSDTLQTLKDNGQTETKTLKKFLSGVKYPFYKCIRSLGHR